MQNGNLLISGTNHVQILSGNKHKGVPNSKGTSNQSFFIGLSLEV